MNLPQWKEALLAEIGGEESRRSSNASSSSTIHIIVRAIFPWLITILLGLCVALSGIYIAYNCDWLGDLRFGYCQNLFFADRKRCCGGGDNYSEHMQRCIDPGINLLEGNTHVVNWVAWETLFGFESRAESAAGYVVAFFVYVSACIVMTIATCLIVHAYSPSAKGSGIPEVKACISGFDLPKAFTAKCLLIKALGLSMAVGAGLSLGKEGPLIHVGVCWAHLLSAMSPLRTGSQKERAFRGLLGSLLQGIPRHEYAAVGAAVGVSTAFGAPLGGVIFTVEELGSVRQISRRCLMLCFLGSFSASFCLKWMNLSGANTIILFSLSHGEESSKYSKEWLPSDAWAFVFLGILGGLIGAAFVNLNVKVAKMRKEGQEKGRLWMIPESLESLFRQRCQFMTRIFTSRNDGRMSQMTIVILEGFFVGAITAILNFPISKLLKYLTVEATNALFETCPHEKGFSFGLCDPNNEMGFSSGASFLLNLLMAAAIRFFLTTITFGMYVPSGLFIPSLFIGACIGRFVWTVSMIFGDRAIEPGAFAIVGASAVLAGFSRLTVSLVVIMFELTGDLNCVIPVMCSCLTAKIVGDYFNESIYDEYSRLNGFAVIEDLPDHVRFGAVCSDIMEEIPNEFIIDASANMTTDHFSNLLSSESLASLNERKPRYSSPGAMVVGNQGTQVDVDDTPVRVRADSSDIPRTVPPVLLLKRGKRRGIFGCVEVDKLKNWMLQGAGRAVDFSSVEPADARKKKTSCPIRNSRMVFLKSIDDEAIPMERLERTPSTIPELEEEGSAGSARREEEDQQEADTDVTSFVDTYIAKVDVSAPIATPFFIFHQNQNLKYVVCLSRFGQRVGVISRSRFQEAVTNGFAYPPLNPLIDGGFQNCLI